MITPIQNPAAPASKDTVPRPSKRQRITFSNARDIGTLESFKNIWDPQQLTILEVRNTELAVNTNVLTEGSDYFKALFNTPSPPLPKGEGEGRVIRLKYQNFNPADMGRFISLLYMSAQAPARMRGLFKTFKAVDVVRILRMADSFQAPSIKKHGVDALKVKMVELAEALTLPSWAEPPSQVVVESVTQACELYKRLSVGTPEMAGLRDQLIAECMKHGITRRDYTMVRDRNGVMAREVVRAPCVTAQGEGYEER